MSTRHLPLIGCLFAALFGCIPSVHPIFTAHDVIFDESLVGTWHDEKDKQRFVVERGGGNRYRMIHTDESGHAGAFIAHLAEVRGIRFLDVYPESADRDYSGFYKFHLFPTHTIYRIEKDDGGYRMSSMDGTWLNNFLKQHPHELRHTFSGNRCLLTASTAELQEFFVEHQDRFTAHMRLQRK